MRFALPITAAALLLPLAACDKGPAVTATNATPAEVQEKLAAATSNDEAMVNPGRWEGTVTIEQMEIPNMPAQAKEQMKARMGGARSFISCVTPEDVKARKGLFTGGPDDKSCKYDHFAMAGGKIDAVMSCDHGNGAKMHMTMTGNYTADSYRMSLTNQATGNAPMGEMRMRMAIAGKRVGLCKGTPDEH